MFTTHNGDMVEISEIAGLTSALIWPSGEVRSCAQIFLRTGQVVDLNLHDFMKIKSELQKSEK